MRKGLVIAGAFFILFLFAGGMLAILGAQQRELGQIRPTQPQPPGVAAEGVSARVPGAALNASAAGSEAAFDLDQVLETSSGLLYALSRQRGFLVSLDQGRSWVERNDGLPRRVVYPFDAGRTSRVRLLTSLNIDPLREGRIAVTTPTQLFLSEDAGLHWQGIPLGKPLRSTSYLTSVALSPTGADTLLVGTSFNGFFETRDRGASWQDPSLSARFLYRGAGFYEETAGLSYHPLSPGVVFFASGFGRGLYVSSADRKSWSALALPPEAGSPVVQRLELRAPGRTSGSEGPQWELHVQTAGGIWAYGLSTGQWRRLARSPAAEPKVADPLLDPFRQERQRAAAGKVGIYVSSYRAAGEDLENHLRFLRDNGLNSLVVDCKDDLGWITYDTTLEFSRKIGAVNQRFYLDQLLARAHAEGIYVIARIVVFKDRQLYNYKGYEHAAWNGVTNRPWRYLVRVEEPVNPPSPTGNGAPAGLVADSVGNLVAGPAGDPVSEPLESPAGDTAGDAAGNAAPGVVPPAAGAAPQGAPGGAGPQGPPAEPRYVQNEFWVDPFDPFVWEYNLAVAEELQTRGVDEIQFDYIRFPSDGNLSQIRYRCQRENQSPVDALESFLTVVREKIHLPISTDLYGFNAWHRMGNWIGQSIEVLAEYVDVISPMFYPSHFPRDFIKEMPYLDRARQIYSEGTQRAALMVAGRSLVRPYVQAFLIGGELAYGPAEYSRYLTNQIEGTLASPSSGFTLWNASNRYYMVTSSLRPYLQGRFDPKPVR
jgi:hypothetical protein